MDLESRNVDGPSWAGLPAAPQAGAAGTNRENPGHSPSFKAAYRPPERSWFDALMMKISEALPAS